MPAAKKKIEDMTDREIQEWSLRMLRDQEKHQKYFSVVLTIYLILTGIGVLALAIQLSN